MMGKAFFFFSPFSSGISNTDMIQYVVVVFRPLNNGKTGDPVIFLLTIQKCSYIIARLVRC